MATGNGLHRQSDDGRCRVPRMGRLRIKTSKLVSPTLFLCIEEDMNDAFVYFVFETNTKTDPSGDDDGDRLRQRRDGFAPRVEAWRHDDHTTACPPRTRFSIQTL